MGKHRHGVTAKQRTATFGRYLAIIGRWLAVLLGRALTYLAIGVIWFAAVLGILTILVVLALFLYSEFGR